MWCCLVRVENSTWFLTLMRNQLCDGGSQQHAHFSTRVVVPQMYVDRELRTSTAKISRLRGFSINTDRFCTSVEGHEVLQLLPLSNNSLIAVAKVVVVIATRTDHLTPHWVHSVLQGQVVVPGAAVVQNGSQVALIHSCETTSGPSGSAPVLVDHTTTVKVNHRETKRSSVTDDALLGIEQHAQALRSVILCSQGDTWILLCGRRGCGVTTAVRSLTNSPDPRILVVDFDNLHALVPQHGCAAVVFWIDDGEGYFHMHDDETCAMTLSKLTVEAKVRLLSERWRRTVDMSNTRVIVLTRSVKRVNESVTRHFDHLLTFGLPDTCQRKRIIAKRHTETDSDLLALATVGSTRSELLSRPLEQLAASPIKAAISWNRIAGLVQVKKLLQHAILLPRQNPERFQTFGLSPPRGVLLYGPPGCAKTSLVKALCSDQNISFVYLDAAELISAYVGESEQILRSAFASAAEKAPSVVFFDEVEIIGGSRSSNGDNSRLLSTLLMELDGFSQISDVCFVGATNMPQLLDSALLRPGRFDQLVFVPLPTTAEREALFQLFLSECHAVDLKAAAEAADGFSGADVEGVCRHIVGQLTSSLLESGNELKLTPSAAARSLSTAAVVQAIRSHPIVPYDSSGIQEFHAKMSGAST
jgi:SpoVK/Ycf46/Vps4 family AAA+-type ATPase